ncbi:MAG TPA: hypothetical protein VMR74_06325 [Gammaproteobacteria bacterium]|nr:hypothetical protein [Gammaproteobacteria bacterium]
MSAMKPCPACNSEKVYRYKKPTSAGGAYGPHLLPGTGAFSFGKVTPTVCTSCGLVRLFAAEPTRFQIENSKHWSRV